MENFSIPGVGGIVEKNINGKNYILLQKRSKADAPQEYGLLEIPAGKIREYENIFDCLRREVKEETGLEITNIEGESSTTIINAKNYRVLSYMPFACSQNLNKPYPIIVQIFICQATGELVTRTEESSDLKWIELNELENLLIVKRDDFYPMHLNTLEKYLDFKNKSEKNL